MKLSRNTSQTKKTVKRLIILFICLLLLAAAAFGIWYLFFKPEEKTAITTTTTYGSLERAIEGSGTTVPYESLSVSLASRAEIIEVCVKVGDTVSEGDLLYRQDDSEIDDKIDGYNDQIEENEDTIIDCEKEILTLRESLSDYSEEKTELNAFLNDPAVKAPHSGRVTGISIKVGDTVKTDTRMATVTDDNNLKILLYFSYIYKDEIYTGMNADITLDNTAASCSGTVSDISYVERLNDAGMKCFLVTVTFDNPGAVSEGENAVVYLSDAEGKQFYPSIDGTVSYSETTTVMPENSGEIVSVYVKEYEYVNKGDILFVLDTDTIKSQLEKVNTNIESAEKQIANNEKKIESANDSIETLNESIAEAEESRADFEVYSEISGKVMYCNIEAGDTPNMNMSAMTIYNLEKITLSVNIDELDIDYINEGTTVNVTRTSSSQTKNYVGTVTYISPEASSSSGVATFPITIEVESNGELSAGVNVTYSVTTGDTEETVLAPVAALKSTEAGYCLYVKSDVRPDNAVELTADDPECPDGFYAVPVEVGSSNSSYVRILSGVDKDTEVFTRFRQTAPTGGDTRSSDGSTEEFNMSDMFGGNMPDMSNMPNMGGNSSGGNSNRGGNSSGGGFSGGMPSFGG